MTNHPTVQHTLHTLTDALVRDLRDSCMNGSSLAEDCDRYLDQSREVAEDDVTMSTDRIIEELNRQARSKRDDTSTALADSGQAQIAEDATEIGQILRTAIADCRMSRDLRERVAACLERADRIVRNMGYVHQEAGAKSHAIAGAICRSRDTGQSYAIDEVKDGVIGVRVTDQHVERWVLHRFHEAFELVEG